MTKKRDDKNKRSREVQWKVPLRQMRGHVGESEGIGIRQERWALSGMLLGQIM